MGFGIGDIVSMVTGGITGSSEGDGQSSPLGAITSTVGQIGDSFASGDWQQGLSQIAGFNASPQGQTIVEDLASLPGLDPLTSQLLQGLQQDGYSASPTAPPVAQMPTAPTAAVSYEQQWASAVSQFDRHFDLLDTAMGSDKDGIVRRGDLEAVVRNPSLPQELRDACRFLLDNPAAFNQLETASGTEGCDGNMTRADVQAARARLASPGESTVPCSAELDDRDDLDLDPESDEGQAVAEEVFVAGSDREEWCPSGRTRFEGMSVEEIVEAVLSEAMTSIDDQVVSLADAIAAKQDSLETVKDAKQRNAINRNIEELTREMQRLMSRRNEMYSLLSNYMNVTHEMAKTAIQNLGRI